MKIGTSQETAVTAAVGKTADKSANVQSGRAAQVQAEAVARTTADTGTQVALSSEATNLLSGMTEDGSFDVEKVKRITQAIAEGKFKINAEAIAGKLIANAEELLDRSEPEH